MSDQPLDHLLEKIAQRQANNTDGVVLIVGPEGSGKSTLMLELTGRFIKRHLEIEHTTDEVLDTIAWSTREEFKKLLAEQPKRSVVNVPDAVQVLNRKRAMVSEQVEIEEALNLVRARNLLVQFGYQDFGDIPPDLAERRAHYALRVREEPKGRVEGYNRAQLDKKVDLGRGEWPDDREFVDTFPNLEETAVWDAYKRRDEQAKAERIAASTTPDVKDVRKEEQLKVALRACKPWDPTKGLTQERAADLLLEFSPSWVSRRFTEWERGEWDELAEEADGIVPPPDHMRDDGDLQANEIAN